MKIDYASQKDLKNWKQLAETWRDESKPTSPLVAVAIGILFGLIFLKVAQLALAYQLTR